MSKSKSKYVREAVTALAEPIAAAAGVGIYDVTLTTRGTDKVLTVYIEKPTGVAINDCETVSRALSDALDAEPGLIDDSYTLEVSSPGFHPVK